MALTRAIPGPMALWQGFPLREKALFFRQLATMIHSAVSLNRAVETAGIATFASLTREMAQLVSQGHPLSGVMERYPHYFNDYEVAAVKTGEISGTMDRQLEFLARELEASYRMQQTLGSKLAYPILIAHAAVFIPPLAIIFSKGFDVYIRMTLGVLIPIYLVAATCWLLYRLTSQSGVVRRIMDMLLAYTPVLSTPVRLLALTRFLRTMSHLQESGVMPDKAVTVSASSCGNAYIGSCIMSALRACGDTARLSVVMDRAGVFPKVLPPMMVSGEESGQLPTMLTKAAEMCQQDMEISTHRLVTLLPVLMLLGVGVVVGYLVIHTFSSLSSLINL